MNNSNDINAWGRSAQVCEGWAQRMGGQAEEEGLLRLLMGKLILDS